VTFDYWKIAVPLFTAIIAWLANEWRKQAWETFLRKETYYKSLLSTIDAFYGGQVGGRAEFLKQIQLCWLYCPDEVIRKAYAFLGAVHENFTGTQEQRETAARELVVAIRRDMFPWYRRTNLRPDEFQLLRMRQPGA
jgi:hypothetical protein